MKENHVESENKMKYKMSFLLIYLHLEQTGETKT